MPPENQQEHESPTFFPYFLTHVSKGKGVKLRLVSTMTEKKNQDIFLGREAAQIHFIVGNYASAPNGNTGRRLRD